MRIGILPFLAVIVGLVLSSAPQAQAKVTDEEVQKKIKELVKALYDSQKGGIWEDTPKPPEDEGGHPKWGGTTALAVYALLTAGESYQNPKIRQAIEFLKKAPINGTYAIGVRCHVWSSLPDSFKEYLKKDVYWLTEALHAAGGIKGRSWRYTKDAKDWDVSVAQYGLLGLWEGAKRGIGIPSSVWKDVEAFFLDVQNDDGGWGYTRGGSYGSMTTAGLACLHVTQDYLHYRAYKKAGTTIGHPLQKKINDGLAWLNKHYEPNKNPGKGGWTWYYLYGVERVGLASGITTFNKRNWYQSAAEYLIKNSGGQTVQQAFSLLFLTRGRVPVFVNKLKVPDYDWNNRPRDMARLTSWVSDTVEKEMLWQVVNVGTRAESWLDAPILYIASHKAFDMDEGTYKKIKKFISLGGLVVTTADEGNREFTRSIEKMYKNMYPNFKLAELDEKDHLYNIVFKLKKDPAKKIMSLHNGIRHLAIHLPFDVSWELHSPASSDVKMKQFFVNLYYYATEKGQLRPRLAEHVMRVKRNPGELEPIAVARVRHSGNWNPEPEAWNVLRTYMINNGKGNPSYKIVTFAELPDSGAKVAHIGGIDEVEFSEADRRALKTFVQNGGTILFEQYGGEDLAFIDGAAELVEDAELSDGRIRPLSHAETIVTGKGIGGFDLTKIQMRPYALLKSGKKDKIEMDALTVNGKPRVLLSQFDLSEGMLNQPVWGVQGYSSKSALEIMSNVILYGAKGG